MVKTLGSILLALLMFVVAHPGSTAETENVSTAPLRIFVSILPTQYFVDRIGGERVQVETLVQPGHSPATYAPTPKQMAKLAASHVYFTIGVPFENSLVPKLNRSVPGLPIVNLQENIDLHTMTEAGHHDDHQHHEGELDPHTWLDPSLALEHARLILQSLITLDKSGEKNYLENFAKLEADLNNLDQSLTETLKPYAGSKIFVFHPAYGYFCHAYNLHQEAITPGGKDPGARHLASIIEQAKKDGAKVIFVQPQFSAKAARTIAKAIGGRVVTLDPLAYNYLENMESISRQITLSFTGQAN